MKHVPVYFALIARVADAKPDPPIVRADMPVQIADATFEPLGVPVVTDLPFGHCDRHLTWPVGARAVLDADRGRIELLESAAA